jgi:hypothetical protein
MKTKLLVILALALALACAGCALLGQYARLSPLDKAIVTADRLAVWYEGTHKEVSALYGAATPEKQAWLRKEVNPKMNDLKGLILGYVDAVALWRATGTEPVNLPAIVGKIDVLTRDVLAALEENR